MNYIEFFTKVYDEADMCPRVAIVYKTRKDLVAAIDEFLQSELYKSGMVVTAWRSGEVGSDYCIVKHRETSSILAVAFSFDSDASWSTSKEIWYDDEIPDDELEAFRCRMNDAVKSKIPFSHVEEAYTHLFAFENGSDDNEALTSFLNEFCAEGT